MTPEQVGPYRIVSQLGRGGMAVVYLARQPALARSVALKELAPFLAGDPALAQRFIREARVAGSLNHPNVVTVFDFLEQDGVPYIAMEYLERGSLRPFVGRMSVAQVAGVLEGLLAALSHAEAMKIVHRDVKPENLLVTSDGGIKIADFGIAKAMQQVATEEMLTPAGATVGTPAYMAPEQAMAQEIGGWTDLYQSGIVAFELLTGAVPFRSDGTPIAVLMQHISDPVPPLPAGTPPALEEWVRRMTAKEPSDRPADARVAWNELEEIILEIQGPLWRRDARLGEHEPTAEHPTPLTPARFSSWQNYVPEEGRSTPAPPPPPTPDSSFSSGYVDYVRTSAPHEGISQPTPVPRADEARPADAPAPVEAAPVDTAPRADGARSADAPAPDEVAPADALAPHVAGDAAAPAADAPPVSGAPVPPADTPDAAAPPAAAPPPVEGEAPTTGFFDYVPDAPAPRREAAPRAETPPPAADVPPPAPPRAATPPPGVPAQPASSHRAVEPPAPRRSTPPPAADLAPTVAPTRAVPPAPPAKRRSKVLPLGVLGFVAAAVVVFVVISSGGGDDGTPTPTDRHHHGHRHADRDRDAARRAVRGRGRARWDRGRRRGGLGGGERRRDAHADRSGVRQDHEGRRRRQPGQRRRRLRLRVGVRDRRGQGRAAQ